MKTHRKGDLTEAIVLTEMRRRGISVSRPFGDNERYDLLADCPDGGLFRVQIKTGWMRDGRIHFNGQSSHTNSQGTVRKQYDGDVDVFVVYAYETEKMYLVGEQEFDKSISFRVAEPKVQHNGINWAEDFEFDERWPLDVTTDERRRKTTDPTTIAGVDALESVGAPVWRAVRAESERNVITAVAGRPYRVRIETGFLNDGRIQVRPDETETDCYVIYCDDLETVYAVDASTVGSAFSLRVSEPDRDRRDTKLASEYEIHQNWPPA
ncbi:group I intron-associated PD-(D/E)XK endonuclease [Haloarchaeobius sp. HRN-SO-5]|uniref:group I intron-associated PD-(D/E)XK endonuclease n=1 Tax=Haloarchaeobius sp. HRN-SO-5 TaxID=3446118 RepID=UPI003EB6B70E